jgi:hypothetical protein
VGAETEKMGPKRHLDSGEGMGGRTPPLSLNPWRRTKWRVKRRRKKKNKKMKGK